MSQYIKPLFTELGSYIKRMWHIFSDRQKKEIEFLQGAFESYKSSLHLEFNDRWTKKQDDLTTELEQQKNKEVYELSKLCFILLYNIWNL